MPNLEKMMPFSTPLAPNVDPVTQASAASLANAITHFITKISGTNAVTGFRLPRGFVVLPTAAFTGATGGTLAYSTDGETEDIPIGKAFTAVADQPILFVTNGALCYPLSVTL
jgi:hypothetical protein